MLVCGKARLGAAPCPDAEFQQSFELDSALT